MPPDREVYKRFIFMTPRQKKKKKKILNKLLTMEMEYYKNNYRSGRRFCCSVTQSCPTLCDPMDCKCQASLSFSISWSLLKLMSIESKSSSPLIPCHPLLLLPSVFPSIRVFSSNTALCIRWPKYCSFKHQSLQ